MKRGALILEDGSEFPGYLFGALTNATGEVGKTALLQQTLPIFSLPHV